MPGTPENRQHAVHRTLATLARPYRLDTPVGAHLLSVRPPTFNKQNLYRRATMSNQNRRHVVPNANGGWDVEKPGASRASAHADTQKDAIARAKEIVGNAGGGEVTIHGRDGKIRDSDTVAPGNDPFPPRDKK